MIRKTDAFAATLLLFALALVGMAVGAKGFQDGGDEDRKPLPAASRVEMSEENKPPPLQIGVLQDNAAPSSQTLVDKDYGEPPATATDPDVEDDLSGLESSTEAGTTGAVGARGVPGR